MSDPSDALASAKAAADRIVKLKRLNACLTPIKELRKSLVVQASTAHPSGVLYGMPVAVKDNICTLEFTTSCGSMGLNMLVDILHSPQPVLRHITYQT